MTDERILFETDSFKLASSYARYVSNAAGCTITLRRNLDIWNVLGPPHLYPALYRLPEFIDYREEKEEPDPDESLRGPDPRWSEDGNLVNEPDCYYYPDKDD